jgi:OOP family OmpA-OmpF porin
MKQRVLMLALLCGLAQGAGAQEAEIFIPGVSQGTQPMPETPQAQSPLARCLANPDRAACAGVSLDPDAVMTESAVSDVTFETLILDLDAGEVTASATPPAAPPDYTAAPRGRVSYPSVAFTIEFDFDSDRLRQDQQVKIFGLVAALNDPALAGTEFAVIGHTDASGAAGYNCNLSLRRALTVTRTLEAAYVPVALYPLGFGEHVLKRPDAPRAAENRRVVFMRLPERPGAVLQTGRAVCPP